MRVREREMKTFTTAMHMQNHRDFNWIYGCRQSTKGLKEVKVGFQWHRWPKRQIRWFIWNERHASEWIRSQQNWSMAR